MIQEQEIFNEFKDIKKKIDLLANPIYNDFGGSHFWQEIKDDLDHILDKMNKDKQIYGW